MRPARRFRFERIRNITLHPNIGSEPLVVSLGCEKLQPQKLFPGTLPVLGTGGVMRLQDQRIRGNCRRDHARRRKAAGHSGPSPPATCLRRSSSVGLQCGGSDAFSGVTCNPAVGYAADLLVRAGAP